MTRDLMRFPHDENGNVLWALFQKGIELGPEREVRFALLFPKATDALRFGVFLLKEGYWVQVNEIEDKGDYFGEVLVDIHIATTHQEISETEAWLTEHSTSLGGKQDGWQFQALPPGALVKSEWQSVPD